MKTFRIVPYTHGYAYRNAFRNLMKPAFILLSLFAGLLTWWLSPYHRKERASAVHNFARRLLHSAVVGIGVYVVLMLGALLWLALIS